MNVTLSEHTVNSFYVHELKLANSAFFFWLDSIDDSSDERSCARAALVWHMLEAKACNNALTEL